MISLFIFSSCEGLLWDGNDLSTGDELTISILNPYFVSSTVYSSRALALQGKSLYIELARIDAQAAYNQLMEEGNLPLTGNGIWQETSWGGQAILTFTLSNISAFRATFKDIPRGEDLKARVIQDIDVFYLNGGLSSSSYLEVGPLSSSYNADASDLFYPIGNSDIYDSMWIDVLSSDLKTNILTIPIRVTDSFIYYDIPQFNVLNAEYSEQYVDSATPSYGYTEPDTTNPEYEYPTKFTRIDIDLSSTLVNLRDPGIFLLVDPTENMVGNVVTVLYESDGSPADYGGNSQRYFYVAHPDLDGSYLSTDLFIGSTNIGLSELSDSNYSGGQYNVHYGVLYDSSAYFDTGNDYLRWSLPSDFLPGDLEFKLLFLEGYSILSNSSWETIEQINALNPVTMLDWSSDPATYTTYYEFDTTVWTNGSFIDDSAVILARVPGGQAFIFARAYYSGA
jgi:hypothetical protein